MQTPPQTAAPPAAMGGPEWAMLFGLAVLWGGSYFFFAILAATLPPLTVVLGRVGFAAVILHLALLATGRRMPWRAPWGAFAVMGLLNNIIPFALIAFGVTQISSGLAAILNATTPVFTVLAAHLLTSNEKLTPAKGLGVLCGMLGVIVLVGPAALSGLGAGDVLGQLCCLLAAVSYAFAGIYGRRFRALPPLQVATGQVTASTLLILPAALLVDRFWILPLPGPTVWAAFAGIAALSTALAYILYFAILARAGATNLLLVTLLTPVGALLLGHLVLGEAVAPRAIAGMALIALGLAAIDGRLLSRNRRESEKYP